MSRKKIDHYCDANVFINIEELIKYININNDQSFIVVGGSQIYRELLPYVDTMYLTEIDENAEADTFFPYVNM